MASLTFTYVPHPLWSEQEKSTFLIFISNGIEHAVSLMSNHVLRPPRVVDQEGARDVVCCGPVNRQVETEGSRHRTQQRVDHLCDGMVVGKVAAPGSGDCESGPVEVLRGEACHNLHLGLLTNAEGEGEVLLVDGCRSSRHQSISFGLVVKETEDSEIITLYSNLLSAP